MEELPLILLDAVPATGRAEVRRWWAELPEADRREVVGLCDARWEECFCGPVAGDARLPLVCGGRFLADDDAWRFADWEADWREYLTDRPDVVLAARFQSRCFLTGSGQVCVCVDWSRTRFTVAELPPSEQWRRTGRSLDRCEARDS